MNMNNEKNSEMSNTVSEKKTNKKETNKKDKKDNNISEEIKEIFSAVLGNISSIKLQLTALTSQIKGVEKQVYRKMKQLDKEVKKNKNKGNRQPSGFAKPTKISSELCKFMALPEGSEMARTEVTKYIIQYVKDNQLQNPNDAKLIKPNTELKSLLNLNESDGDLTYFNIQRFMNKHFVKA
jgi:chromatin remodeling complex protein RSC6